jgi:hypothetical protein
MGQSDANRSRADPRAFPSASQKLFVDVNCESRCVFYVKCSEHADPTDCNPLKWEDVPLNGTPNASGKLALACPSSKNSSRIEKCLTGRRNRHRWEDKTHSPRQCRLRYSLRRLVVRKGYAGRLARLARFGKFSRFSPIGAIGGRPPPFSPVDYVFLDWACVPSRLPTKETICKDLHSLRWLAQR